MVSDADRAAERAVVDAVRAERPADAILAEEGSSAAGSTGLRWLVDPLDGTTNYLYGHPHWSVSVACLDAEGAVAAVVFDPGRDELFRAARGSGAWLGDRRLAVTTLGDLERVLLATGFAYDRQERAEQARRESRLIPLVRDVRRGGSAALDLAYVAAGRVDAYHESFGEPWDWAAGTLLVREAGGVVSEVAGVRAGKPGILASGPALHAALLGLVASKAEKSP